MNLNRQDIELIAQYLSGQLTGDDLQAFESRLTNDVDLKEKLAAYRVLFDGFKGIQLENFIEEVEQWEKKQQLEELDPQLQELTLIEQYCQGQLSGKTLQDFEYRLNANPQLYETVKSYQLTYDGFKGMQIEDFQAEVMEWETEQKQNTPAKVVNINETSTPQAQERSLFSRIGSIAAGLALLFALGTGWWANNNYSNSALLSQHYKVPIDLVNRGSQTVGILERGAEAFKNEKYQEAISTFHTLEANADEYVEAQLYIGHSYMQLQQYDKAITTFGELALKNDSRFSQRAEWEQILAKIASGKDQQDIKTQLQDLANNSRHAYQAKAKNLLQQYSSSWRNIAF